jgi:thymidine phosphorylase
MEILSGNRAAAPRLHDLTVALGGRLLALVGGAEGEGEERIRKALDSGQAMERFARMVAALGGPPDMAEDWRTHLPAAPVIGEVLAREAGFVTAFDGEALGLVVVALGGGRRVETDRIDPAVGLTDVVRRGARVEKGQPLATIHARDEATAEEAAKGVLRAIRIGEAPALPRLVRDRVG